MQQFRSLVPRKLATLTKTTVAKVCANPLIIINMTKLLDADWLRGVQLFH
jgi:hypothetical protein